MSIIQRHGLTIFVVCALTCYVASCRVPTMPLIGGSSVAYIYDPKSSDAIADRFSSPPSKELNSRYRTALAEPVSVVEWGSDRSTWEIFYATNRLGAPNQNGKWFYGKKWGTAPEYGTCRITLPKSERGTAADVRESKITLTGILSGKKTQPKDDDPTLPKVFVPTVVSNSEFGVRLRETVNRSPERDLFLFVHGFNVDFDSCVTRAAQIGLDLPFNGAIVAYSWPSQGGIKNYPIDERLVEKSVRPFVEFLEEIDQFITPETRIHILVHSMGNRLVLGAMQHLSEHFSNPPRFENVILAAPDVGVAEFKTLAPALVACSKRVSLYVNESDTALIASKALHDQQRIGDSDPPVLFAGIETIDASAIETSFMGHSYYGSNRRALSDLFALIKEERGASQRSWLKGGTGTNTGYWRFQSQPVEVRWVWYFENLIPVASSQTEELSVERDSEPSFEVLGIDQPDSETVRR